MQRRGPHPALQRPCDAAAEQAARRRAGGRQGAQPRRARALGVRDLRPQPHHPCAGDDPRADRAGNPQPGREFRDHGAVRPAGAGADGARIRRGGRRIGRGRARPDHRLRAHPRRHHPPHRGGQSPRAAAADAHAGDACLARERARGGGDHRRVPGHGPGGARPVHRHHRRGSAAALRAPRRYGRRVRRFAAHRVAAGGHARRRPDRGGAPADREPARAADQAGGGRRVGLAEGRQLLADAGGGLPRQPAAGGIRRPRDPLRAGGRGRARAPRRHLDRRPDRVGDDDGVADRRHGNGRRGEPAHA